MSSAGNVLGRHLRAVTDGETGERDQWIGWQVGKLTSVPGIEVAGVKETSAPDNEEYSGFPALAVDASVTELPLRALGYADAAEASYQLFDRLRSEGTLPPELKFQVSVPRPMPAWWPGSARRISGASSTSTSVRSRPR